MWAALGGNAGRHSPGLQRQRAPHHREYREAEAKLPAGRSPIVDRIHELPILVRQPALGHDVGVRFPIDRQPRRWPCGALSKHSHTRVQGKISYA